MVNRNCSRLFLIYVLFSVLSVSRCQAPVRAEASPDDIKVKALSPAQECPDRNENCIQSIDAIQTLHKQIDDDASGNIDQSESDEFFREELQNTNGFERQSIFHGNDKQISMHDLWHAWKKSAVYNWTIDDVVEWLVSSVELPQYTSTFQANAINGSFLPRIAVNCQHFITKVLNIKNPVHKHKLSLKAMDTVLFGPQKKGHNVLKDIFLVTSLVIAVGGCWFAYLQNKQSKIQVKKMIKDLDALQKAEDALAEMLQKKEEEQHAAILERNKLEQKYHGEIETAKKEAERLRTEREDSSLEENSRLALAEQELQQVRDALQQAEHELETGSYWNPPTELQQWLQYTYEIEQQHFTAKQQAAQRQFSSAKDACEKIRKKRTGMLGTLRIAQGNSIDDIDQRILQARMALEEIRHDLQERQQRWQAIETCCGFPIKTNPGLSKLELVLYGETETRISGSGSRLALSMVAPLNVEEADEDFPPQYSAATAMLFHSTKLNGCSRAPSTHTGEDKPTRLVKAESTDKVAKYFKKWRVRSSLHGKVTEQHNNGRNSPTSQVLNGMNFPIRRTSYTGGMTLQDMKRRQGTMGSSTSLSTRLVASTLTRTHGSQDNLALKSTTSSTGSTGSPQGGQVSFHLGSSPASSPDSTDGKMLSDLKLPTDLKMTRSKSHGAVQSIQNGSRIPTREVPKTLNVSETGLEQRANSESNFQRRPMLQHQSIVTQSSSTADDESLSGTESADSDPKHKEKKKRLKLIPKFMRKTESDKQHKL